MYFKNISNEDLRQFHPVKTQDFIMSLTDVLDSNLFKIENHDGIYRIFPLFYCNSIKSNNPTDNILENRCIIASNMSEETYFTFSTGESSDLPVIPSSFLNDTFKGLDSDLTTGEYNKFVYMVRENYPFNDTIRLNKLVTGSYGNYHFRSVGDDMGTVLDNGILLSDSLKQNGLQVMLSDPVFHYSRYLLHLKIYDFGDGDIPFDGDLSNASVTDLSVELVNGEYVDIQFPGEYRYAVIGIDATVEIVHDKPIIIDIIDSVSVDIIPDTIQAGNYSEIYATGYDNGYMPVHEGQALYFFEKYEPNLKVLLSKSNIQTNQVIEIYADVRDNDGSLISDFKVHFFEKYEPNIGTVFSPSIIQSNDNTEIYADVVDDDGSRISDFNVHFFEVFEQLDLHGTSDIIQTGGDMDLYCKVKDADGSLVQNKKVHFFEKVEPSINISSNAPIIQTDENTELYAKLKDIDGSLIQNTKIHFFKEDTDTINLNNNMEEE